jgi:hypothetical protein
LDPKNSSSGTQETLSIDRRTLTKSISALDTFLALQQESTQDMRGEVLDWATYEAQTRVVLNREHVLTALNEAFDLFYIRPFDFPINEEIEISKGTTKEFTSASEIIRFLLDMHALSQPKLKEIIKTTEDINKLQNDWLALFKASPLFDSTHADSVIAKAIEDELKPDARATFFIRNKFTHKTSVCSLPYIASTNPRKTFLKENYPQFVLRGSNGTPLHKILDARLGTLQARNKRFICKEELAHVKDAIQVLAKKYTEHAYFIPLYDPTPSNEVLTLIVGMPLICFSDEVKAEHPGETHILLMAPLRRGSNVINTDELSVYTERLYARRTVVKTAPEGAKGRFDLSGLKDDLILEFTVDL